MLTFWCYRLGVATPDLSVFIDDGYQHRFSVGGGHHIPKELKRTKLWSYRSWEVHAQARVVKSTQQLYLLEGAQPAGLVSQRSFKVTIGFLFYNGFPHVNLVLSLYQPLSKGLLELQPPRPYAPLPILFSQRALEKRLELHGGKLICDRQKD